MNRQLALVTYRNLYQAKSLCDRVVKGHVPRRVNETDEQYQARMEKQLAMRDKPAKPTR